MSLPPLRHRRRDIPGLVDHFVAQYAEQNGTEISGVSREAMDLLMRYRYPGNVRELQNVIERAVVMARDAVLSTRDLPPEVTAAPPAEDEAEAGEARGLPEQVEALERQAIRAALEQAGGNQSRAAEILGLTERNLRYKLRKYGLR